MSLSHRCGAILSPSSIQNFFNSTLKHEFTGFQAWMDCLRSCHGILIGFKSGLWFGHSKTLILFFLSNSEVDLLVCLGSLSCCITQDHLSLRSQTDGWTFSFRIFWECRINGSINYGKSARSWSCKAAPDHHTTTTIFDCWYDVLCMKGCVGFMPDVTGYAPSKTFNICLISPQNIWPEVLGIIKIFFWQMWGEPLYSFWSAVAFALELSHGWRFCPVSFLLLNHEPWPYLKQVRSAVFFSGTGRVRASVLSPCRPLINTR